MLLTDPAETAQPAPLSGPDDELSLRELAACRGVHLGVAVARERLGDGSSYGLLAGTQFSSLSAENDMKWYILRPHRTVFDWDAADQVVSFARRHHQQVRGHCLVWHDYNPDWLAGVADDSPARLRAVLEEHITATVGRYAGRVECWDVVNEPLEDDGTPRGSLWSRALGPGYIAQALTWARESDPAARLYINEHCAEGVNAKSDALFDLARGLLDRGVPLDGIGFQAHLELGDTPPTLLENLQRFADLGLDIAVTELDIRMPMPAAPTELRWQATQYNALIRAVLGIDRCRSITFWGVTDSASWIPRRYPGQGAATLYDGNYGPKPAYHAVADALRHRSAPDIPVRDPFRARPQL